MIPIYLQALSFKDVYGTSEECIHEAAEMASNLGLAGIDIEDRLLRSYDPNYLQELAHQVEGMGVRFGYCGLMVDFSAPISSIENEIGLSLHPINPINTARDNGKMHRVVKGSHLAKWV